MPSGIPGRTCGTASCYAAGCRCGACRRAKAVERQRNNRVVVKKPHADLTPLEEAVLIARGHLTPREFAPSEISELFADARAMAIEDGADRPPHTMTRQRVDQIIKSSLDRLARGRLAMWEDVA